MRSQGGVGSGLALCTYVPAVSGHPFGTVFFFRILLIRRLRLPLPLTVGNCQCGLPLDSSGHHRAACARAGSREEDSLWRGLQSAFAARRERGRVTANVMVRHMDLIRPDVHDTRRLDVVVGGLSLFGDVQLAPQW